jgi:hypothetical protein
MLFARAETPKKENKRRGERERERDEVTIIFLVKKQPENPKESQER